MFKIGDRVTAPRGLYSNKTVSGVVVDHDEGDERGWLYQVAGGGGVSWTHKDETVLVPDPTLAALEFALVTEKASVDMLQTEKDAQDERIAQLTLELAETQVQTGRHKALAEHWEAKYENASEVSQARHGELEKARATIAALKALVCDVSDAAAAKEAIWFATETYNAKAEKARGTLAALKAQEGTLSWYSPERGE